MLWGLFKKVVIADNLAPVVDAVYAPEASPTPPELIIATYAFTIQLYCDFSGYTDIARGTARLLGFDIVRNFNLPYAATSPVEYWRRWHISLSTWLRDYLFFSQGGNRGKRARVAGRILITMGLGGLWHGAAWPFVLWGLFHGLWLILHRMLLPGLKRIAPASRFGRLAWHALRVFVTFHGIAFSLLLFRAESLGQIATLLGIFGGAFDIGKAGAWLAPLARRVALALASAHGDLSHRVPGYPSIRRRRWTTLRLLPVLGRPPVPARLAGGTPGPAFWPPPWYSPSMRSSWDRGGRGRHWPSAPATPERPPQASPPTGGRSRR